MAKARRKAESDPAPAKSKTPTKTNSLTKPKSPATVTIGCPLVVFPMPEHLRCDTARLTSELHTISDRALILVDYIEAVHGSNGDGYLLDPMQRGTARRLVAGLLRRLSRPYWASALDGVIAHDAAEPAAMTAWHRHELATGPVFHVGDYDLTHPANRGLADAAFPASLRDAGHVALPSRVSIFIEPEYPELDALTALTGSVRLIDVGASLRAWVAGERRLAHSEIESLRRVAALMERCAARVKRGPARHGDDRGEPERGALDRAISQPPEHAFLSEADVARTSGVTQSTLRKHLPEWRKTHQNNDWHRNTNRRPRDPEYTYRWGSICPLIDRLRGTANGTARRKSGHESA